MLKETLLPLLIALLADAFFGYPDWLFRAIGHPVTWIGASIGALDRALNRERRAPFVRRLYGIAAIIAVVALSFAAGWGLEIVFDRLPGSVLWIGVSASTLMASRSLFVHVSDVARALDRGLDEGRAAVSKIVGRDPSSLDTAGVARAAIESLAENASDGVVAPAFWFALLGLPGLAAYKAINTADSMIGHRTSRHASFGWAAARLDDVANLPASRLTAVLLGLAGRFEGAPFARIVALTLRDAPKHRSPNAGWPEAAMAANLELRLGGPRRYGGILVEEAYLGDGRSDATADDIRRAVALACVAWGILVAGVALGAAFMIFAH